MKRWKKLERVHPLAETNNIFHELVNTSKRTLFTTDLTVLISMTAILLWKG